MSRTDTLLPSLKIALVILHAEPKRGGAERYTADLAAALAERGHDVRVVATRFAEEIAPPMRVRLEPRAATRAGWYRRFLRLLDEHLEQTDYDVVHAMLPVRRCDVYHPHAGLAAEQVRKWNSLFNPRRLTMAAVEATLLARPDPPVVLTLSQYVKRNVLRHYPTMRLDRLATLFNAVDLERFQPSPAPSACDLVKALFIGQDFERKGLMTTLLAAAKLQEPRLKISVVGGRSARFHPPADLAQQVDFIGEVSDPRPYYADADFFVLPTKHDPCSLVVLEALAMGLPVISTKFNGATEIMTDGVHGYVLNDPEDVTALAEAMRKLMDPKRREEMSRACLALRPRLSYAQHIERLERIYRDVVTRTKVRSLL